MKPKLPKCPECGHPLHLHTREGCWWQKYDAGEWPCRCGQPVEQLEPVEAVALVIG